MSYLTNLEARLRGAKDRVKSLENELNSARAAVEDVQSELEEAKRLRDVDGNILDIRVLDVGDTARLPFNDLRLLPTGRLVVHPTSTNLLYNFKENDILVQKTLGGLKVFVKSTGHEGPKIELYSSISNETLRLLDKEWNRVVAVEEKE